jgi:hypothetical protein
MTAHTTNVQQMSIHIDSCAVWDTLVVNTGSSVYELIVLRGDGDVVVRSGSHSPSSSVSCFLGSTADGSSLTPRTIEIGLRMIFKVGDQSIVTSPVQSLSRPIDWIFVRNLSPLRGRVVNERSASDHAPVLAEFHPIRSPLLGR